MVGLVVLAFLLSFLVHAEVVLFHGLLVLVATVYVAHLVEIGLLLS